MLDTVLLFAILAIVAANFVYVLHRSQTGARRIHNVVKTEFVAEVARQTEAIRTAKSSGPLLDVLRANPGMGFSEAKRKLEEGGSGT